MGFSMIQIYLQIQNYYHHIIKEIMKYRPMTFEMPNVIIYHLLKQAILAKMETGTEGQFSSINP